MKNRIEQLIGNTPLIKLGTFSEQYGTNVYAKLEFYNPGMSAKDRPALFMLKDAMKKGHLSEGGTVVEASSGNTGLGLAMLARSYNMNCVIFTTDKISQEKINVLEAQNAEVNICPSSVSSSDPRSTYKMAEKYADTHENAFFFNQYYNQMNPLSHYETTGPEIYAQTDQKITHFLAGVGTGGTISGVGKYLKEQNPDIEVIGIDAVGSVLKKYFDTGEVDPNEKAPYTIEGIGKGFIPSSLHIQYIDEMIQVNDLESIDSAQLLCHEEGMLPGYSCGSVLSGFTKLAHRFNEDDHVVLVFPDHGCRYISKIYNPQWIAELKNKSNLKVV